MSNRWWGWRSNFEWEEDALRHIQERMPTTEPYRAWHNFTFTAPSGHVREVNLLIATPAGFFLVEIKSHRGTATNDGSTWVFRSRTYENPLYLADLKARELKSRLEWARNKLNMQVPVPRIKAAVFLSAPDLRCEFDDVQRTMVYGREGLQKQTGLQGIWSGLLDRSPPGGRSRVDPTFSKQLHKLRGKIGVQGPKKHRQVGPFELETKAFDTGPAWEDYLATNTALPGDEVRRIRVYLSELGATEKARESTRRAARREYLSLQGIAHDGIVRAEQFSDDHDAGPTIVFRHGKDWHRLDHFMAERGADLEVETRVEMVRQLAEAVDHAHRRHLYHRALAARSVYVELDGRHPRLRICDWQVARRRGSVGRPTLASPIDSASLAAHVEGPTGAYLAPEFGKAEAEGTQLDVFGLGALSHLILTGRPPARDREELLSRLSTEHSLSPSALSDDISPTMDEMVRGATFAMPSDRLELVRNFLDYLELVEEELTEPEQEDLLEATKGAEVAGYRIERVLGKGSTAKALLVTRNGHPQVLKVALNDSGRHRLAHEAARLREIHDSHIVRLIDGPREIGQRTVLVLEQAGEQTLAQFLRHEGLLTIDDLDNLGDHLFQAVEYLEGQGIWHRDIKPDNLAIRQLPKKGRRLVLFDFSLADVADRATEVGTQPYLDPFLGTGRRPEYDALAERYAVAVTLHEMASAELPSWGDGIVEASALPANEQLPQFAEDSFDPLLRDRLVAFFRTALHRDPGRRHGSLKEMRRAWSDVFRDLDKTLPATTRHPTHEQPANVTAGTPLVDVGLSARALSIALRLDVSTVGELVKVPAARVQRLRGVGLGPRNELVRRAREWRRQLDVAERVGETPKGEGATGTDDLRRLSLDTITERLVPRGTGRNSAEVRVVRLALALPDLDGHLSPVPIWAPQALVAEHAGMSQPDVSNLLGKARERWADRSPAVTALRRSLLELLDTHGRVMEARQLAAALLADRGSELDDPAARMALAEACVRAAVETEEHLENPRLARRRSGGRVLIASVAEDDPSAPTEEELLDYAVDLGSRADALVRLDEATPLPSVTAVREALAGVAAPPGMPPLSDLDLISLAAAASANAAVTARLELYPRDLDARKALRLSQAAGYLGHPGIEPDRLRARVLARFPELTGLPEPGGLRTLLREMGHDVEVVNDGGITRYALRGGTTLSSSVSRWPAPSTPLPGSTDEAEQRLRTAAERGGYLAVKARLYEAAAIRDVLRGRSAVTPLNVTETFVTTLREIVAERGRPRWETVLAADTADASPAARTGLGRLLDEVGGRLDRQVRSATGVVLLHDVTPLVRYPGGMHLLNRLAVAARDAEETPYGLWLLCPMDDPARPADLDGQGVGALGDNEQLTIPHGFAEIRRAS